jgi:glycine hydroxymethyltransferase
VALREAAQPAFKTYGKQIVKNAKRLAEKLMSKDYQLVTGGTDNHLLLIDLTNKEVSGQDAETALHNAGITVNKNTVPFDPRPPFSPSGIRMGTPALTTRGLKEKEMDQVAEWIGAAIKNHDNVKKLARMREEIREFTKAFPLPGEKAIT